MFTDCSKLTSVFLKDGVEEIGNEAFASCYELVDMSIPRSMRKIGEDVVWGNYSLSKIRYGGTKADWQRIKIHKTNERLRTRVILCNDGTLKWNEETGRWIE